MRKVHFYADLTEKELPHREVKKFALGHTARKGVKPGFETSVVQESGILITVLSFSTLP